MAARSESVSLREFCVPPTRPRLGNWIMLKSVMHAALALTLLAGTAVATSNDASARGGRTAGVVAGTIIGLGVLGAYAASREPGYHRSCYPGRQRCDVVGQRCFYNRYGEYICKDDVRCYRPQVCD